MAQDFATAATRITQQQFRDLLAARWPNIAPDYIMARMSVMDFVSMTPEQLCNDAVQVVRNNYGNEVADSDARVTQAAPTTPAVVSPAVEQPTKPESLNYVVYCEQEGLGPRWMSRLASYAKYWTWLGCYNNSYDMFWMDGEHGPDLRVVNSSRQCGSIVWAKELLQRSAYEDDTSPALACAYLVAYEKGLKGCEWCPPTRLFREYVGQPKVYIAAKPLPDHEVTEAELLQMNKLFGLMGTAGTYGHAQGQFNVNKTNKTVELISRSKWFKREEVWKLACCWKKMGFKFTDRTLKVNGGPY